MTKLNTQILMSDLLERQLRMLRQKPFSELQQLENHSKQKVRFDQKPFTVGIWKCEKNYERIDIIVQVYEPWFLGVGKMLVKGIRVNKNGNVEELREEELYEFT